MAATDRSRSEAAKQRRQDQLQRWQGSETDLTAGAETRSRALKSARVRFAQGAVFMAACSSGDRDEVAELLRQGADINHANVDGLTALHQACIDENAEMVQFLVESGSDVNRGDNEGWTPLHAAASCGFIQITKYLIEHGAQVGAVNSEGELPLDVATEEAMERLLKAEIKKQGVDVEHARREEERVMMQDAMNVLAGSGSLVPHPNTKATPLHVAAAKGYIEVLKVLLKCKLDVDSRDCDGWTALHAAAHWGQEEACGLLVDHMCDMNAVNNVGQTALDVADENLVDKLEELQKKQNAMRIEKLKIQMPVIETSPPISMAPVRPRRTSISRMSSKEKITLHEREKHPPPSALQTPPTEEEEEEQPNPQSRPGAPSKASSSSSSEEESESESDAESASDSVISSRGNSFHHQHKHMFSASSVQEPRLARVQPTPSRRLFSVGDGTATGSTSDNPSSWLSRSSSYTRRLNSQSGSEPAAQNPSLPRSSSYGRKLDDPTQGTSGLSRLNSIVAQRLAQEESEKKEPISTTTTTTASEQETKQRRRSYLTPVRDEEAEAQRKARSRHARQSRRSTQGVTLTDLQEAEKTIKTDIKGKETTKEEEEKEAKQKKGEEGEVSWRSREMQRMLWLKLRSVRRRRRARARRRERLGESEDKEPSAEDESSIGPDLQPNRCISNRSNPTLNDCLMAGGSEVKDYKRLFEKLSRENTQLQSQLQDTLRSVSVTRMELEKATQRQERFSDCTALLELEKKEKVMLERRAAELEEELKVLGDLKADNQRLKDENGALIRVISKLSK
ncbi:hypothetical protein AMELA_G00162660 [Ameiurus melas]|uniref:Protein phosphatase 1 regulatory subunit n=1 Tax=Ameiurus melas TaxID=219545 RepID=A0A7J6AI96_AMEME|nr:hypothetical protein AMELA_G00162660 [Ameiurus melas]